MIKCCALFVFVSLFCFGTGGKLPSIIKVCSRNDPELEVCFAKAIQDALTYLKQPIPELGLPSLNPALMDTIKVSPGSSSSVNLTQTFRNIKVYNLLDTIINKTEITIGSNDFTIVIYNFNKITKIDYEYEMEGKILLVPIDGKGNAHLEFGDIQGVITLNGVFHEKGGNTYAKLNKVLVDYKPGKLKIQLDHLYDDERLATDLNKLMNENWQDLLDELRPSYSEAFAIYFNKTFGAVFDRVPFIELFPF